MWKDHKYLNFSVQIVWVQCSLIIHWHFKTICASTSMGGKTAMKTQDCPQNILLWLLNLYYQVPLSCFFTIMWYNVHVHLKSFLFSCILLDNDNSFSRAMITFLSASDTFKKFNYNKSLWVYCSKLYMISKLRFSLHTSKNPVCSWKAPMGRDQ